MPPPPPPSAAADPRVRHVVTRPIHRVEGVRATTPPDALAVEEPLEIQLGYERRGWRVHKSISVTMRTPGHDAELAVGFLFTEQIITGPAQVASVGPPPREDGGGGGGGDEGNGAGAAGAGGEGGAGNVVRVELHPGVPVDLARLERHFYTTSSCGVCGKTSIAALGLGGRGQLDPDRPRVDAAVVHGLPATLRATQAVFDQTGGLHAAALFTADGRLLDQREDVGRHNAVDKLIGAQLLGRPAGLPLSERLLLVSGRASFELVQKALAAGIPLLAAVGAPSSLAVSLAERYGATLLGFVRQNRFNVYCGAGRIEGLRFAAADRP